MSNHWHSLKIQQLQNLLEQQNLEGAFFFHHVDFFYFIGINLGDVLYIPKQGRPFLFVRKASQFLKNRPIFCEVVSIKSYKDISRFIDINTIAHYGFMAQTTPVMSLSRLWESLGLSFNHFMGIDQMVKMLSMIKSEAEIQAMEKASLIVVQTFERLKQMSVEGKSEVAIAIWVEEQFLKQGALTDQRFHSPNHCFHGSMVLTKENINYFTPLDITYGGKGISPAMALGASETIIESGFPWIIDTVCHIDGLFTDITRTFVIGEPDPLLLKRYQDLDYLLNEIILLLKPDVLCSDIYRKSLEIVEKLGYKDHFMGIDQHFLSFIGHGVGVYVDDFPVLAPKMDIPLQPNMVITVEPKFYFHDFFSVGIENIYQITKSGARSLVPMNNDLIVLNK